MSGVRVVNGSTYVHDDDAWISYYTKTSDNKSFVPHAVERPVATKKTDQEYTTSPTSLTTVETELKDMQDVELVSPVQGAVQQARAQYARADPIKRRTYKRRKSKKSKARRRPKTKKRRKRKKVSRLKKKQYKKKRKLRKKRTKKRVTKKKRDIFTE